MVVESVDELQQRGAERKQSAVGKGVIALPGGKTLQNGEEKRFSGRLERIMMEWTYIRKQTVDYVFDHLIDFVTLRGNSDSDIHHNLGETVQSIRTFISSVTRSRFSR